MVSRHDDESLEFLLRAARPLPNADVVADTERRLLGRQPQRRSKSVIAAAGLSGVLAAGFLAATLVGAGPLGQTDDSAKAKPDCQVVTVTTVKRRGELVLDADGTVRVVTRVHRVPHAVKRCR